MKRSHILHAVCGAGIGSAIALAMLVASFSAGSPSDRWLRIWATMTLPGLTLTGAAVGVLNPLLTAQLDRRNLDNLSIAEILTLQEQLHGQTQILAASHTSSVDSSS